MINQRDLESLGSLIDKITTEIVEGIVKELRSYRAPEGKQTEPVKKYLTLEEASNYLGLSKKTLYQFTHKKTIPYYKPNRNIYFNVEDLDKWITQHRISSEEEVELEALRYLNK